MLKQLLSTLPNTVKEYAVINDPTEGRMPLLPQIEQGHRLPESGLKQLDHAFDLAKYTVNDPAEQARVDAQRSQMRDILAANDLTRHLQETGQSDLNLPDFEYKGQRFPKAAGPQIMRAEHDTFIDKDRWMTPAEVREAPVLVAHGTRPADESSAAYGFLSGSVERSQETPQQKAERLKHQKRQAELMKKHSPESLQKSSGLPLPLASLQYGMRKEAAKFLYGLHNSVSKNKLKEPQPSEEQQAMEAYHPLIRRLGGIILNTSFDKGIGQLGKGYEYLQKAGREIIKRNAHPAEEEKDN